MVFPLVESPLGGNLGATTASFFKLDPTGTAALEPLIDLIPGITPLRITFDMVDNESATFDFDVTEHAIQDFLDVTSNIHKKLRQITISGTLGATPPLLPVPAPPIPGSTARLDLLRVKNLVALADQKQMIMFVTPRVSMAKGILVNVQQQWSPPDAESTRVGVTIREARLVSPLTGDLVAPDYPSQTPGNNATSGGGQSSTTPATGSAQNFPSAVGPPA